jgi:two-component system, chemotaxis family, protein-glutamate methylesterase/glutaminase
MKRGQRIRALVAEDSPTQRKLIVAILRADPEFEVVGEAVDGQYAVEMANSLRPDVITMDVAMPRLGGLEATLQIMQTAPTPIIVCSDLDRAVVEAAMRTLNAGALAVLRKPPSPSSPRFEEAARSFVRQVKLLAQVSVVRHISTTTATASQIAVPRPTVRPELVAAATSTGGPPALRHVLGLLPADFDVPILVLQHIAHGFVDGLASWLDSTVALRVKVAEDGEVMAPGHVYVAPDDRHLVLFGRRIIRLDTSAPVQGFRPAATAMFASVAREVGAAAVGVMLTGMGRDGVDGLVALRAAGGRVLVQDEQSSIVYGMPKAAVEAGVATEIGDLDDIARWLLAALPPRLPT